MANDSQIQTYIDQFQGNAQKSNAISGGDANIDRDTGNNTNTGIGINPNAVTNPDTLISNGIYYGTWALGVLAVIILIFGGIKYITAGGDAEKAETGKKTIIGAVIGIIIIMGAYVAYTTTTDLIAGNKSNTDVQTILP